jgi:osmotically-inducible protein OsmY
MMLKRSSFASCALVMTVSLALPVFASALEVGAVGDNRQNEQDQAITAAVKTRLAATRLDSFAGLEVEVAEDGTVWLSGTTPTEEAAERAVDIARNADGVMLVKSRIKVQAAREVVH